ncbi:MAG: hypothetical protein ACXVP0_17640 [Bacteroidia bacterium]
MSFEIHLLKGFGTFNFGQTADEALKLFGPPEETQTLEDDILKTSSYVMHYWTLGVSLFFDNLKNKTFSSVEVDNPETILFGKNIFELNEKQLGELMKQNGYALSETEQHTWGEKRLSFDDVCLDCYFENGRLSSINFGVLNSPDTFSYFPN